MVLQSENRDWFADTSYFLALLNPSDDAHARARKLIAARKPRIVTTEFVLTELADAMAFHGTRGRTLHLIRQLSILPDAEVVPVDHTLYARGLDLYASRPDKDWSLTDCISFTVMTDRNLIEALTGDHHFEQAGFVPLLK